MAPYRIASLQQYHKFRGLAGPAHPLISVFRIEEIARLREDEPEHIVQDFYSIALKQDVNCRLRYGQQDYDFTEGRLMFIAPQQVYSLGAQQNLTHAGWALLVHPDFFYSTALLRTIRQYAYFDYAVHEALVLTEPEEAKLVDIFRTIHTECQANINAFSKPVIVSWIEVLLNCANRYYHRQFLTREREHREILIRLEELLTERFRPERLAREGVPTVVDLSAALHLTPSYLSSLLRVLTGKSTQQHLQDKIIERAKERLSLEDAPVGEIAYGLGFDYPQSFSKLFRARTGVTPSAFRRSFG
ncbi:helix-turn-helix domain-containing protein [Neolewinella sp.]|uniref:helix-turn-helix domain-containing protein n=1 Tax=Neolewinella sp. TaxID=2993543 RepID=UPI003B518404